MHTSSTRMVRQKQRKIEGVPLTEGRVLVEPTLLNEDAIQVTRRQLKVGDQTYALRDITSVTIASKAVPRAALVAAVFLAVVAISIGQALASLTCLVVGFVMLVALGLVAWLRSRTYILVIGTSNGDTPVYTSRNRQLIDRIAQAIDAVVVEQRRPVGRAEDMP